MVEGTVKNHLKQTQVVLMQVNGLRKKGKSKLESPKISRENQDVASKNNAHMLHGAGIFINMCPKNHPVL